MDPWNKTHNPKRLGLYAILRDDKGVYWTSSPSLNQGPYYLALAHNSDTQCQGSLHRDVRSDNNTFRPSPTWTLSTWRKMFFPSTIRKKADTSFIVVKVVACCLDVHSLYYCLWSLAYNLALSCNSMKVVEKQFESRVAGRISSLLCTEYITKGNEQFSPSCDLWRILHELACSLD